MDTVKKTLPYVDWFVRIRQSIYNTLSNIRLPIAETSQDGVTNSSDVLDAHCHFRSAESRKGVACRRQSSIFRHLPKEGHCKSSSFHKIRACIIVVK